MKFSPILVLIFSIFSKTSDAQTFLSESGASVLILSKGLYPKKNTGWQYLDKKAVYKQINDVFCEKNTPSVSEVSFCVLDRLTHDFLPDEFLSLPADEKHSLIKVNCQICFITTKNEALSAQMTALGILSARLDSLEKAGNFSKMASLAERIAFEFPSIGHQTRYVKALILANQRYKALTLAESLSLSYPNSLPVQLNLAHAYLFTNQYALAEKQYLKFKNDHLTVPRTPANGEGRAGSTEHSQAWIEMVETDFAFFKKHKIENPLCEKIKKKWALHKLRSRKWVI
jgi:hypothetical protein